MRTHVVRWELPETNDKRCYASFITAAKGCALQYIDHYVGESSIIISCFSPYVPLTASNVIFPESPS